MCHVLKNVGLKFDHPLIKKNILVEYYSNASYFKISKQANKLTPLMIL